MFTPKRTAVGGILLGALALIVFGAALWYTQLRGDAPSGVSMTQAVNSIGGSPSADRTTGDFQGKWEISANGESFVGYRVREELRNIGATTAVGRTTAVTGALEFDGEAVRAVSVEADLRQLRSDNSVRDGQLRRQALETGTYPTASFVLAEPIPVDRVPAERETISADATGDLTIHGVTRRVTIPLQGQIRNGLLVVVGSTNIEFSDFNMAAPRAGSVLWVDERAVLEVQLVFEKDSV
jgi:polyisoprenoid-binding protein YceI